MLNRIKRLLSKAPQTQQKTGWVKRLEPVERDGKTLWNIEIDYREPPKVPITAGELTITHTDRSTLFLGKTFDAATIAVLRDAMENDRPINIV